MNRSTLLSVLLVGLLVAQGGAYGLSQNGSALSAEASAPDGGTSLSSVGVSSIDAGSSAADSNNSEPTTEDTESDSSDGESESGDETESEDEADGEDSENDDASSSELSGESDGSNDGEDDNGDSDGAERDSDDTTTVDDSPSEGATTDEEPVTTEVNTELDDGSESASDDETPADSSDHDPTSEEEASDGDTESPTTAGEDESDGDSDDTTAEVETETETQTKADADSNTEPGTETPQEPESTTEDEATHTDATDEDDPSSASADPKTDSDSDGDPEAESGSESDGDSEESGSASSEDKEDEAGDTASNSASSSGNDSSSHTESSGENTASDTGIATDSDFDDTESEGDTEDASDSDPESESEPNEDADNTEQAVESSSNDDSSSDGESRSADGTVSDEGENADDESTEALTPVSSGASLAETTAQGGSNPGGESEGNDDARSGDEESNDEVDIETLRADDEGEDDDESDGEVTEADNDEGDEDNESGADTEDGEDGDSADGSEDAGDASASGSSGESESDGSEEEGGSEETPSEQGVEGQAPTEAAADRATPEDQAAGAQGSPSGEAAGGQAPDGDQNAGEAPGGGQVPGGAGGQAGTAGATAGAGQGQGQGQQGQAQQGGQAASSDADFDVVDSELDAPIGSSGALTVELENDGEDADNAVVNLQSQTGGLTFGGSATASQFVGEWEEGETRTIEVDASVATGAAQRSYPVQATVSYQNDDNEQVQSPPVSFGVTPDDEQDFTLDDVDSSLSAGQEGTISGTITNEGPEDAEDAVLVFAGNGSDVLPRQSEVVLGDLDDDESVDFEYPVAVEQGAPPGERQVPFVVEYQNEAGNTVRSGQLNAQVEIDAAEDQFEVTDIDSDLEPGETGTVEVTIENQREDLTDATISLQSVSPAIVFGQAANTSKFVGEFEEGDTQTIELKATATQTATEGEYPVQASVSYTDEDNQPGQGGPIIFGVPVDDIDDDFEVTDVDSDLEPGETGTVEVTVENEEEDVTDARVTIQSLSPSITFGQAATANASVFVGEFEEGDTETVEVRATVAQDATEGEYPMQALVSYVDEEGRRDSDGPFAFGVPVGGIVEEFEVASVDSDLEPGERGTVEVTLNNTFENVTDATVSLQSVSPAISLGETVNTSQFVGDWNLSETKTVEVQATAAESATEGEYPIQTTASYTDGENRTGRAGPLTFGAGVSQSVDDFEVVNVNSTVPVGGEGTIRVTLNNTEENATEATVSLESISSNFQLGEGVNATQFVGRWGVGERRTVEYEVSASNATEQRSYAFRTSVSYTDSGNQGARGGPFTIGVTPLSEQSFALSNTTANLRVGSEGNVSGAVTNEGPQVARNAVVQLTVNNPNIDVQQNEVALGTLQAGETANFSFSVDLSSNAEAGVQQFAYVIEYDNQDGEPRRSERLKTQVEIEPDRNAFIVGGGGSEEDDETDGTNQTDGNRSRLNVQGQEVAQTQQSGQNESEEPLTPGESRVVTVPITNNRDVTYRNIEVQAFTNDPLSLADDQAFISELRPGETATVSFEVSVSGDALPGTYPISMDFQYDTPDGDTQLSDTYEVPIEVEEQEGGLLSSITDGGIPWLLIVVALLVAGVLGYLLYRQRNEDDADDSSVSFESTSAIESGATTGSSESTRQIGSGETSDSSDSTED